MRFQLPKAIWLFPALLVGCASAGSAVTVTSRDGLIAAIAGAKGGETLTLAPGDYGAISINNKQFTKPLTITSARASEPAQLTVAIDRSANIVFKNLSLGRALAEGEPEWTQLNNLSSARNIRFDTVHFHGSLDGNPVNDCWGLYTLNSENITITNSEFEQLIRAFVFDKSRKIEVSHNRFHDIRSDGGDFAGVEDVLIDGNHYTDFYPLDRDHADAVQFWTREQTQGSYNIRIVNNVVLQGKGLGPQGFFIGDEVGNLPHRNLTIENNLIYSNDQWEGILVAGSEGVTIANNTVLSDTGNEKTLWIRLVKDTGAKLTNNVTDRIVLEDTPALVEDGNMDLTKSGAKRIGLSLKAGGATGWRDLVVEGKGFQPTPDMLAGK